MVLLLSIQIDAEGCIRSISQREIVVRSCRSFGNKSVDQSCEEAWGKSDHSFFNELTTPHPPVVWITLELLGCNGVVLTMLTPNSVRNDSQIILRNVDDIDCYSASAEDLEKSVFLFIFQWNLGWP